jgi:hypothetical protein
VSVARGAVIALGILGVGMLAVGAITGSKVAGVIGVGGQYDMAPAQVKDFVKAAATRQGWEPGMRTSVGAFPKPGEEQLDYSVVLLPWMTAHVTVQLWPEKSGTGVQITGHATTVKDLKTELNNRLPALTSP